MNIPIPLICWNGNQTSHWDVIFGALVSDEYGLGQNAHIQLNMCIEVS